MNIKRYETKDNWSNKSGTYIPVLSEDEDGEWVKYSEAKGIIDEYRKIAKDNADWYDCLRIDFKDLEIDVSISNNTILKLNTEIKKLREALKYCDKISGSLIADPLMCIRNKCREALKDGK